MIEENVTSPETAIKSEFSILELGTNLVKTSQKKIEEKHLIIIGDKASGKSSVFNTILQSTSQKENYTPTCGINYSYMRYQPTSNKKYILNLYEIGGGIKNLNLLRTIINEKNIKNSIFVLTLDFSQPSKILKSLKDYMKELSTIIKESFDNDTISEMIENKRYKYKDINSNDFKRINFFPVELIVVGMKYDYLEKIDVEKIKWTCRALRFFSHLNALSLVYYKAGDQKLAKILNGLFTGLAFTSGTDSSSSLNYSQKNDILPIYILYGNDSLIEIGDPKVIQQGNRDVSALWEDTFYSVFPSNSFEDKEEDLHKFEEVFKERYQEPRIDEEVKIFE